MLAERNLTMYTGLKYVEFEGFVAIAEMKPLPFADHERYEYDLDAVEVDALRFDVDVEDSDVVDWNPKMESSRKWNRRKSGYRFSNRKWHAKSCWYRDLLRRKKAAMAVKKPNEEVVGIVLDIDPFNGPPIGETVLVDGARGMYPAWVFH